MGDTGEAEVSPSERGGHNALTSTTARRADRRPTTTPGRRYASDLTAVLTTSAAFGLIASVYLPHPLAVMTLVGALTAAATAPFITRIPDREDT